MTLHPIETLKTSIYSPKHTKNTKIHIILSKLKKQKSYVSKKTSSKQSAFYADLYSVIYIC